MNARGEFRAVPALLWESPGWQLLSSDARLTWLALKGRCGPCGVAAISALEYVLTEWTGLDAVAVRGALSELEGGAMPWIRRERQIVVVVGGIDDEPSRNSNDSKHRTAAQKHLASLPRLSLVRRFVTDHPAWFVRAECDASGLAWAFGDGPLEDAGGPPQAPSKALRSPFEAPSKHGVTETDDGVTENGVTENGEAAASPPTPSSLGDLEADDIREALPDAFRPAFDDALAGHRNPRALLAELRGLHAGSDAAPPFPWETIGRALHELAVAQKPCTPLLLRAFCGKIASPAREAPASPGFALSGRARFLWWLACEHRLLSPVPDILERIDGAVQAAPEADRESLKADLLAVKVWELGSEHEERFAIKRIEERLGDAPRAEVASHFSKADCDALHGVWAVEMGPVDYARFRRAFGRLFPAVPPYTVEQIAAAVREACEVARSERGFDLRALTPESFVDRAAFWVAEAATPLVGPGGMATPKLQRLMQESA